MLLGLRLGTVKAGRIRLISASLSFFTSVSISVLQKGAYLSHDCQGAAQWGAPVLSRSHRGVWLVAHVQYPFAVLALHQSSTAFHSHWVPREPITGPCHCSQQATTHKLPTKDSHTNDELHALSHHPSLTKTVHPHSEALPSCHSNVFAHHSILCFQR